MSKPLIQLAACVLLGLAAGGCALGAGLLAWGAFLPADVPGIFPARGAGGHAVWAAGFLVGALTLLVVWLRRGGGLGRWVRLVVALAVAAATTAGALSMHRYRWDIVMRTVPSAHDLPIDAAGYQVQKLPFRFAASFARGGEVYFVSGAGEVSKADDADPATSLRRIGSCGVGPRMLFVSSRGTIFVSGSGQGMVRSGDGGKTWNKCMDWSVWRMDEDAAGGGLYAGNYSPRNSLDFHAAVFRSDDDGAAWREVFTDRKLDHVHTVRVDEPAHRIYIAAGDGPTRGQLASDDGGASWRTILAGAKQGHTDVALTDSNVIWGSDDWLGRIILAGRGDAQIGRTVLWCRGQQVWFVAAEGRQAYAGTFAEKAGKGDAVYLLASDDGGASWRKLLARGASRAGPAGLIGESRRLSAAGWLYFTTTEGECWRVRRG